MTLPLPSPKGQSGPLSEAVKGFWVVPNMFSFDNVGFAHAVGDFKYLCCADCEIGPIGAQVISTKELLLAADRVMYINDGQPS